MTRLLPRVVRLIRLPDRCVRCRVYARPPEAAHPVEHKVSIPIFARLGDSTHGDNATEHDISRPTAPRARRLGHLACIVRM